MTAGAVGQWPDCPCEPVALQSHTRTCGCGPSSILKGNSVCPIMPGEVGSVPHSAVTGGIKEVVTSNHVVADYVPILLLAELFSTE